MTTKSTKMDRKTKQSIDNNPMKTKKYMRNDTRKKKKRMDIKSISFRAEKVIKGQLRLSHFKDSSK